MKSGFVVAVALAVTLSAGLAARPGAQPGTEGQVGTAGAVSTATVTDILSSPERYYGQTVMVSGEVSKLRGKRVFTLLPEKTPDRNAELLVLWKKDASDSRKQGQYGQAMAQEPMITENSTVQATGTLRRFVKADIEREYRIENWADWGVTDHNWLEAFHNKPVLIADKVTRRGE